MLVVSILQIIMRKYKEETKALLFLILLIIPVIALGSVTIPNPIGYGSFEELVHAITSFIRNVALVIAPILFIYAGLKFYMAAGDPGKAKEAADVIKWTAIGLAVILVANGITAVIKDVMGVN